MSGPQGPDPTMPWQGQQPSDPAWQTPPTDQPPSDPQAWGQPPAYNQPQYPQYQQPSYGQPQYPQADQYGQQPTAYGPTSYAQPGQYGQQPQYGQPGQYDQQPQYGQQPGQYGEYQPTSAPKAKKSGALIGGIVGAIVLIVIIVGVLGFWKPGFFMKTELDVAAAQTGVQQILSDETNGYGAKNVEDVKCNNGANPKVEAGKSFECDVSIDGTSRQVTVTFKDNDGTYEVGRPK